MTNELPCISSDNSQMTRPLAHLSVSFETGSDFSPINRIMALFHMTELNQSTALCWKREKARSARFKGKSQRRMSLLPKKVH